MWALCPTWSRQAEITSSSQVSSAVSMQSFGAMTRVPWSTAIPHSRDRLRPADHPADVLGDQQVELAGAEQGLDLGQFGPVEPLALAGGGDDPVLDRAVVQFGHDLLGVVDLVVQAQFLLVRAAADAGDDADDEGVPVPRGE